MMTARLNTLGQSTLKLMQCLTAWAIWKAVQLTLRLRRALIARLCLSNLELPAWLLRLLLKIYFLGGENKLNKLKASSLKSK